MLLFACIPLISQSQSFSLLKGTDPDTQTSFYFWRAIVSDNGRGETSGTVSYLLRVIHRESMTVRKIRVVGR